MPMKSCLRNIRMLIKNKEYDAALEAINKSLKQYDSDELLFYKAYTLGEMNNHKECIEQYITLIQKNETKEHLQGIIRILDKDKSIINNKTIQYYKKLNMYDIKESRLEMNELTILEFYENKKEALYENIKEILQNRLKSHEDFDYFKENVLVLASIIDLDYINLRLKDLYNINLQNYISSIRDIEVDTTNNDSIRSIFEEIYLKQYNESIFKYNFLENLLFKISKNYVLHDKRLMSEIFCDFIILLKNITTNDNNYNLNFLIHMTQSNMEEIIDARYIEVHHKYLAKYFKDIENLAAYFDKNIQVFFVYFYDFYHLSDFVIKKNYNINDEDILYMQRYFSCTVQILRNKIIDTRLIHNKDNKIRNFRRLFDFKLIDEFLRVFRADKLLIPEIFYYYIYFLKYDSTKEEYLSEVYIFFENTSEKHTLDCKENDFLNYFDNLVLILKKSDKKNIKYLSSFFQLIYNDIWIYKIFSELICYLLKNELIDVESIQFYQSYFKDENFTDNYKSLCLYFKYKMTKDFKYIYDCIETDILCYFALDEYIFLKKTNNISDLKIYLKKAIGLQNKMDINNKRDIVSNENLTLYEKDSSYVYNLAKFYISEDKELKALSLLELNKKHDFKYYALLGFLYYRFKQINHSEKYLRKANELKNSFRTSLTLSKIFYETDRFNLAVSILEDVKEFELYANIERLRLFNKNKQYEQSLIIIQKIPHKTENYLINEILSYEQLKAGVYKFEDTGENDIHFSCLEEYKMLEHEVNNLKLFNNSLQIIYKKPSSFKSNDKLSANSIIFDTRFSCDNLYKAYNFYLCKDLDKAKLFLAKGMNDYSNRFLYFFLQIIIENKNVILVYENLINSYKLKYFDLFVHATHAYIKKTTRFNSLDSVIEIFEKSNIVKKFSRKCTNILGKLNLLNGEINKCKEIMGTEGFNKIYEKHRCYIESFIALRSGNFSKAYKLTCDMNYDDEYFLEYKKYIKDKVMENDDNSTLQK